MTPSLFWQFTVDSSEDFRGAALPLMWLSLALLCCALAPLAAPSFLTNHSSAVYELDNYGVCPRGAYQVDDTSDIGGLKRVCELCPRGKYGEDSGSSSCTSCPKGTHNPMQGSKTLDDCMSCPAGTYSSTTAASRCTECAIGKYSKTVGAQAASTCLTCPSNYYYDTCRADLPSK